MRVSQWMRKETTPIKEYPHGPKHHIWLFPLLEAKKERRITRLRLTKTYLGDGLVLELTSSLGELRELGSL